MKEILLNYKLPHQVSQFTQERNVNYNPTYVILKAIFNALLSAKKINLRSLLNNTEFPINEAVLSVGSKSHNFNIQYDIYIVFSILKKIYDSTEYLKEVLLDLEYLDKERFITQIDYTHRYNDESFIMLVNSCLPFLVDYKEIDSQEEKDKFSSDSILLKQKINSLSASVEFTMMTDRNSNFRGSSFAFTFIKFYDENNESHEIQINPFTILRVTFDRILSITNI